MNKDQIQKIALSAVVVLGGLFLYVNYLYIPTVKKAAELSQKLEVEKAALAEARKKKLEFQKLKDEADIYKGRLKFAIKRLPSVEQIPVILKSINRMATESSVIFFNFVPQALSPKDFYTEVPVRIELHSGYHDLGEFLNRLNDSQRLMMASDIQFSPFSGDRGTVKAALLLTAFVIAEDPQLTARLSRPDLKEVVEPIRGLFYYDGGERSDPFKPLTVGDLERLMPPIDLANLRLTGLITVSGVRVATLQDSNNFRFVCRDGRLYSSSRREIAGVKGVVQADKVTLWRYSDAEGTQKVTLKLKDDKIK